MTLIVATSGPPLPVAELETENNWRVGMVTDAGTVSTPRGSPANPNPSKPGTVDGERAVVTEVNKGVRHHAEAALEWNIMEDTSVSLKYQYGSVPPLFQLVDHQVTRGITLKAAQK